MGWDDPNSCFGCRKSRLRGLRESAANARRAGGRGSQLTESIELVPKLFVASSFVGFAQSISRDLFENQPGFGTKHHPSHPNRATKRSDERRSQLGLRKGGERVRPTARIRRGSETYLVSDLGRGHQKRVLVQARLHLHARCFLVRISACSASFRSTQWPLVSDESRSSYLRCPCRIRLPDTVVSTTTSRELEERPVARRSSAVFIAPLLDHARTRLIGHVAVFSASQLCRRRCESIAQRPTTHFPTQQALKDGWVLGHSVRNTARISDAEARKGPPAIKVPEWGKAWILDGTLSKSQSGGADAMTRSARQRDTSKSVTHVTSRTGRRLCGGGCRARLRIGCGSLIAWSCRDAKGL